MMQQLPSQTDSAATDAANGAGNSGTDGSAGSAIPSPDANLQNPADNTNTGDNFQNVNNSPSTDTGANSIAICATYEQWRS